MPAEPSLPLRALREAGVTLLAATLTLACTLAIAPGVESAVLAVVLCISLSRSELDRDRRGRIEAALALPVVGLVAVGVGTLLHRLPWLGAAVFVAGLFVSIWLRRFGPMARRAGSLIALPFVALLTAPPIAPAAGGAIPAVLAPIVVALIALWWVGALHALARRLGFLSARGIAEPSAPVSGESALRSAPSTRMAIQMAVALALGFIVGFLVFPERWSWIVLTAFIVQSGNRGRLDVAYKSVLRIAGAAGGTLVALLVGNHLGAHDAMTVVLILAAIFLGLWLRPLGYAWWALFVTLALALLQGYAGMPAPTMLWPRLEEIVIGAAIGVASAWFVLPVRSTGVLRRRIADALAALSTALDPATPQRCAGDFVAALSTVEKTAPPFRLARAATKRWRAVQPADWIDALDACREPAVALIERKETPPVVRRAAGAARKAMREPDEILPALEELRRALVVASRPVRQDAA